MTNNHTTMNPTTGSIGTSLQGQGLIKDMRPFAELSIEEKVERLANELRNGRYVVSRVAELDQKLRQFERHSHCEGKVVVEMGNINNFALGMCAAQTRDPLA